MAGEELPQLISSSATVSRAKAMLPVRLLALAGMIAYVEIEYGSVSMSGVVSLIVVSNKQKGK